MEGALVTFAPGGKNHAHRPPDILVETELLRTVADAGSPGRKQPGLSFRSAWRLAKA